MSQPNPPQPNHAAPLPQAAPGERRARDRRQPWKMWLPTYVLRYCDRIGSHGLTLYAWLAWHCTRESPIRWPSLAQLGREMAVSRSTVERTMRLLRAVGLVELTPCVDENGQKSNFFDLTDPPEFREQPGSHGTPDAGAVTGDGAPPSPLMGGDITGDGGAPSPVMAPTAEEGSKEERENGSLSARAPAQQDSPDDGQVIEQLAAHWLAQLPVVAPAAREMHAAEIAAEVRELLRRGWTVAQLWGEMDRPDRDRMEWPRQWRARLPARPPKVARKPLDPAEVAHKRAQEVAERERAARELAELREHLGGTLNPHDPRFRRQAVPVKGQPPSVPG
jgi:hypothetical protein